MSKPTIYEKNNLPIDVRYAFNEGVEITQTVENYELGFMSEEEFITKIRNIKKKYNNNN